MGPVPRMPGRLLVPRSLQTTAAGDVRSSPISLAGYSTDSTPRLPLIAIAVCGSICHFSGPPRVIYYCRNPITKSLICNFHIVITEFPWRFLPWEHCEFTWQFKYLCTFPIVIRMQDENMKVKLILYVSFGQYTPNFLVICYCQGMKNDMCLCLPWGPLPRSKHFYSSS